MEAPRAGQCYFASCQDECVLLLARHLLNRQHNRTHCCAVRLAIAAFTRPAFEPVPSPTSSSGTRGSSPNCRSCWPTVDVLFRQLSKRPAGSSRRERSRFEAADDS